MNELGSLLILSELAIIKKKVNKMTQLIDDIKREVEETKAMAATVMASQANAAAAIQGIKAALDAAIAANDLTGLASVAADLDAVQVQLTASSASLDQTVVDNTPAAPVA